MFGELGLVLADIENGTFELTATAVFGSIVAPVLLLLSIFLFLTATNAFARWGSVVAAIVFIGFGVHISYIYFYEEEPEFRLVAVLTITIAVLFFGALRLFFNLSDDIDLHDHSADGDDPAPSRRRWGTRRAKGGVGAVTEQAAASLRGALSPYTRREACAVVRKTEREIHVLSPGATVLAVIQNTSAAGKNRGRSSFTVKDSRGKSRTTGADAHKAAKVVRHLIEDVLGPP